MQETRAIVRTWADSAVIELTEAELDKVAGGVTTVGGVAVGVRNAASNPAPHPDGGKVGGIGTMG
jgi:hypothetical protein